MAAQPYALAPARLKQSFIEVTNAGMLGGSSVLDQLSEQALACVHSATPRAKTLAYVLHKVLAAIAANRSDRAVTLAETQPFLRKMHQPILRAIEFLNQEGEGADPSNLACALIDLEQEFTSDQ